jgi:DNA processing protein
MVKVADLSISSSDLSALCAKVRIGNSSEDEIDYFSSIAWSVICEPGDAFAGQLISTFGAARALSLELARTVASSYVSLFAEAGSDWVEMQKFGRFERTLSDARERWSPRFSMAKVTSTVNTMATMGGWFATDSSEFWPNALHDLENHAPRGLWGIGTPNFDIDRAISVVGSRVSTSYGEYATGELIGPMATRGFSIISGGAYGIDAQAHRATLALGGKTISVMAGGLDRLYPSGNRELFNEIANKGLLLSEMPPGAEPTKWRFLQRNRLIAALGQAIILVEANARSGAVSTANRGVEIGRPIGAVPGPINAPGSDGCHQLIRGHKADLITCADDILELLGESSTKMPAEVAGLGALETRVLDVIGPTGADLNRIRSEGGLTAAEAEVGIAGLSLLGYIEQDSSGWRRRL